MTNRHPRAHGKDATTDDRPTHAVWNGACQAEDVGMMEAQANAGDEIVALLRMVATEVERERRMATAEIDRLQRRIADLEAAVEKLHPRQTRLAARQKRQRSHWLLTDRELDVLELLAMGFSEVRMMERLGISRTTLKSHSHNLYQKLGVHSATQAALYAWRQGIVSIDEAWAMVESMQFRGKTTNAAILPAPEPARVLKLRESAP